MLEGSGKAGSLSKSKIILEEVSCPSVLRYCKTGNIHMQEFLARGRGREAREGGEIRGKSEQGRNLNRCGMKVAGEGAELGRPIRTKLCILSPDPRTEKKFVLVSLMVNSGEKERLHLCNFVLTGCPRQSGRGIVVGGRGRGRGRRKVAGGEGAGEGGELQGRGCGKGQGEAPG